MGVWNSIKGLFEQMSESSRDGERGAYWCHACEVRVPEEQTTQDTPSCPECGRDMEFERKAPSACC